MNENRSNNVGQYILVQRTPNAAPRASSAPPANQNTNVVSIFKESYFIIKIYDKLFLVLSTKLTQL